MPPAREQEMPRSELLSLLRRAVHGVDPGPAVLAQVHRLPAEALTVALAEAAGQALDADAEPAPHVRELYTTLLSTCIRRDRLASAFALLDALRRQAREASASELRLLPRRVVRSFLGVSAGYAERPHPPGSSHFQVPLGLWLRYLAGSEAAVGRLYVYTFREPLRRYLHQHWAVHGDSADDLLQETAIRLLVFARAADRLIHAPNALLSWCTTTLQRLVHTIPRRPALRYPLGVELPESIAASEEVDVESELCALADAVVARRGRDGTRLGTHIVELASMIRRFGRLPATGEIQERLALSRQTASRVRQELTAVIARELRNE